MRRAETAVDGARFNRIEALFHAALEQPAELREAFLRANEDDAALLVEVRRLLDSCADDAVFLHSALTMVTAMAALAPTSNMQIGPYRILAELGSGGMGTVLLAERLLGDTPQRVALKLIRGMPTTAARKRLARERALLAELNHPNIARLVDAGETAEHIPYLAIEYVDGTPLLTHCAEHDLDVPARLRLFAPICRAIEHAHQHLILHRDIKPANVLMRQDGAPVLLDFGIGKLLDPTSEDRAATRAFTPAYAAPEQRVCRGATTATDVYGLGCVLHELLSERSLQELSDDERIPAPSEASHDPARARALRGDLDTMVGKALHTDPEQRYASAGAFADDVDRYLCGRPILAHAPSTWYRMKKFTQRHRVGTAVVAILALALFVTAGMALREARATVLEAQRANAMHDFMITAFKNAVPSVRLDGPPRITEVVEQAIATARNDAHLNPDARIELLVELGEILRAQGHLESARQTLQWTYDQALADLDSASPLTTKAGLQLERTLILSGDYEAARALIDDLPTHAPRRDAATHSALLIDSAQLAMKQGDIRRALRDGGLGLAQAKTLGDPDALAEALNDYGGVQLAADNLQGAAATFEESLTLRQREFGREHLFTATAHANLSRVYRRQGRLDEAEREIRTALAIDAAVLPQDDWRHANHLNALMMVLMQRRDFKAALDASTETLRIARAAYPEDHPEILTDLCNVGLLRSQLGDFSGAVAPLREALALSETKSGAEHAETALMRANYGFALARSGDIAAGEAEVRRAVAALEAAEMPDTDELAQSYEKWVRLKLDRGDAPAALALIDRIDALLARVDKPNFYWDGRTAMLRGRALLLENMPGKAADALDVAAHALAASSAPDAELQAELLQLRAQLAREASKSTQTQQHASVAAAPKMLIRAARSKQMPASH